MDAPAWTPVLLAGFVEETFDVDYFLPSCRRLLKEAGPKNQTPRLLAFEGEVENRDEFHDGLTQGDIERVEISFHAASRAVWHPRGTRPSVEISGLRDWMCLLGVVTVDGGHFSTRLEEYVTAAHAKHFTSVL